MNSVYRPVSRPKPSSAITRDEPGIKSSLMRSTASFGIAMRFSASAAVEEGFLAVRSDNYVLELDRSRAIQQLLAQGREGDAVLIAGKGHETYQEFEDTVVPFDDRVHAQEALEALGFGKGRE